MNFLSTFGALAGVVAGPRPALRTWGSRMAFRRSLALYMSEPHLLQDMGFAPDAVAAEVRRRPWEPIRLRRSLNRGS